MTIALIDNGSIEPGAVLNLRQVAAGIAAQAGVMVHPVSWRHSNRIPADQLEGKAAPVLAPWLVEQLARGERKFVFVPFFISGQGAIGSALHAELEAFGQSHAQVEFSFAGGLAARDAIIPIVVERIRETIAREQLLQPTVIVVDHGGPSAASALLRDELAGRIAATLESTITRLSAASLEGGEYPHNRPLLAELLGTSRYSQGDVVIAPLFLTPGRHAGPEGDIARTARAAAGRSGGGLRCHLAGLVGSHPRAVQALAESLREHLDSSGQKRGRVAYP